MRSRAESSHFGRYGSARQASKLVLLAHLPQQLVIQHELTSTSFKLLDPRTLPHIYCEHARAAILSRLESATKSYGPRRWPAFYALSRTGCPVYSMGGFRTRAYYKDDSRMASADSSLQTQNLIAYQDRPVELAMRRSTRQLPRDATQILSSALSPVRPRLRRETSHSFDTVISMTVPPLETLALPSHFQCQTRLPYSLISLFLSRAEL